MNVISIKLNKDFQSKILLLKDSKFLAIQNNKFWYSLFVPSSINFFAENSVLTFSSSSSFPILFLNSLKELHDFLLNKPKKKILFLKGLGLKVKKYQKNLEFKLGFSHKSYVSKNIETKARLYKKKLAFISYNKIQLGNNVFLIKKQKLPDNYKGKGIWYKNEKKKLKIIKKK